MTAEVGLPFAAPEVVPNTRRSLATAEAVRQRWPASFAALDRSLFAAYWAEGRDIGSADVVDDLVAAAGAPAADVRSLVESGGLDATLERYRDAALDAGVTGTPAWLIDGRALIPGYQERSLFERVVERLTTRG